MHVKLSQNTIIIFGFWSRVSIFEHNSRTMKQYISTYSNICVLINIYGSSKEIIAMFRKIILKQNILLDEMGDILPHLDVVELPKYVSCRATIFPIWQDLTSSQLIKCTCVSVDEYWYKMILRYGRPCCVYMSISEDRLLSETTVCKGDKVVYIKKLCVYTVVK